MNDQRFAVLEIGQNLFRAPPQVLHLPAR
jgi:hypothetical protein